MHFDFLLAFPELGDASEHFGSWIFPAMWQMLSVSSRNVHGQVHFDVLTDPLQAAPGLPGGPASLLRNLFW